jgi:spore maturation protein CgeB
MKNFLGILPESIAGRLIISALFEGFREHKINVDTVDLLKENPSKVSELVKSKNYNFLVSYDYEAVKINEDFKLNLPVISYFSDNPESDLASKEWVSYFELLKNTGCYTFLWDEELYNILKEDIYGLYYLPLFVNTKIYKNLSLEKEYDIMFAGRMTFDGRLEAIERIMIEFPELTIALFSYKKHFDNALKRAEPAIENRLRLSYKGFLENEFEVAREINKSKAVLNFTSQGTSNLNYRVYETLACETLLLTDYRNEIDTLFEPGVDIICYRTLSELLLTIDNYFSGKTNFEPVIMRGRESVEKKYSCSSAAKKVLDVISG